MCNSPVEVEWKGVSAKWVQHVSRVGGECKGCGRA